MSAPGGMESRGGMSHHGIMTAPAAPDDRPVFLSEKTAIPASAVWAVCTVLIVVGLYLGRQLQRLDTIETNVREMRADLSDISRTLRVPPTSGR